MNMREALYRYYESMRAKSLIESKIAETGARIREINEMYEPGERTELQRRNVAAMRQWVIDLNGRLMDIDTEHSRLGWTIGTLPELDRRILRMRFGERRSVAQVAEALNFSASHITSKLQMIIRKLSDRMG